MPASRREDEEGACAGESAAAGVQEELGAVAAIKMRPPEGEIAPGRFCCGTPERDQALLPALADDADDPLVDVDAALLEGDGLGNT